MLQDINPSVNPNDSEVKIIRNAVISNKKKYEVDIIIPYRSQHAKTMLLVESLLYKVKNVNFDIILCNDGKENKNFEDIFKKISNVKFCCTGSHKGFGAAVNLGIQGVTKELCCVMHNDIQIDEPNFLYNLVNDLLSLSSRSVATMSVVTNNPMSNKLDCMKQFAGKDEPPRMFPEDVFSPFICTMMYKKVIDAIGKFPEYPLCWFEGDCFGKKIILNKGRQAYSPRSYVFHHGGTTILNLLKNNPEYKEVLQNNFNMYQKDVLNLKPV
jgi:GT2 family glycosyltransferase